MRKHLFVSMLIVIGVVLVFRESALAQSQPDDSYTFNNLTSGVETSGSNKNVYDFAWSYVNATGGTIEIRSTLSDSGYHFTRRENDVLYCNGPTDTWVHQTTIDDLQTLAFNVLNVTVAKNTGVFSGSLTVESLGHENFYVFSPNTFSVSSSAATECQAYHSMWANGSWNVPWFWDGTANALISPYANVWYNDAEWTNGWNTPLSLHNGGNQSTQYTIKYRAMEKGHGKTPSQLNPSSCSTRSQLSDSLTTSSIAVNGTWNGNLRQNVFNPTSGYTVQEDGFLWVLLNPTISGTTPSSSVSPSSGGSAGCGPTCSTFLVNCQ